MTVKSYDERIKKTSLCQAPPETRQLRQMDVLYRAQGRERYYLPHVLRVMALPCMRRDKALQAHRQAR